jgi:hypothetical protein
MFGELRLLYQVGDFLVKAAKSYVQSPEGAKELQDIEDALSSLEQDGSNAGETIARQVTNTLDQARAAVKASKGG